MQANYVQRLRLTFGKQGATRFIGHLDLARALERSLLRARIPVAYSQGFNRRPRMQLAAALPLGVTSDCELADIWLTEETDPAEVQRRLGAKMAPGIELHRVEAVPLSLPTLQTETAEASYVVSFLDPVDRDDLTQKVETLLAAEERFIERRRGKKTRRIDVRRLIVDLQLRDAAGGQIELWMRLFLQSGRTGRPDDILLALRLDPLAARIRRTEIALKPAGEVTNP